MYIIHSLTEFVLNHGYIGIFIATALEYACFPVSSEILFPFIGYCIGKGELNIFLSLLISDIASVTGCSFCYCIGRFGQKFLNITIFRLFPQVKLATDNASEWFTRKGNLSVLFGRLFPLVRTYISFPAGVLKMNYLKFIFFTSIGASIWNTLLISTGYLLKEHWEEAKIMISNPVIILCLCLALLVFIKKHISKTISS